MPEILHLIDGHALAYRTYFAMTGGGDPSRWTTTKGEPTAGVFGFTSVLLKILKDERPDYIAVAFDTGRTFRDDMYAEYKGTREKMPDDLALQIERIRQLVDAFNIPRLEMDYYEADDVLGSVARHAVEQGLGVKIYTGDRDLLQLVDERIIVNLAGRSLSEARNFLPADVQEYMGVTPNQIVDYKALTGDTSDNIPGVAGIGDKTAVKLLSTYGTLDDVYAHLDELTPGMRKKLEEGKDNAYLSQKLARIVTDLAVQINLEQARPSKFDPLAVEEIFRELEFRALIARLKELERDYGIEVAAETEVQSSKPVAAGKATSQQLSMFGESQPPASLPARVLTVTSPTQWAVIDTPEALESLEKLLLDAPMIAFDTETTGVDPMQADIVGISLSTAAGQGVYIPVGHNYSGAKQLSKEQVYAALRKPLCEAGIPKAGHNIKYDWIVLARQGLPVDALKFDTMVAEWLINPASRNLGLKSLSWVRLNVQMTPIDELIGKGKNQRTMAEVAIEDAAAYAAADADISLRLVGALQPDLASTGSQDLFDNLEMPLIRVLADMEMAGVGLDTAFLNGMSQELEQRLNKLTAGIYDLVGASFNVNSPQQLSDALFKRLQLTPPDRSARTSSGHYSTSADVLEAMREAHPAVEMVLEHRELSKLKSTYLDALPLQVNPQTGRVHTSFNQTGSVTGRIASSEPNLQNIPIRSELGREVRKAFVAAPGNVLLAVDYSQVELRIAAHMSDDKSMLAAFQAGQDIHATTAAAIQGVALDQVDKNMRRHAKAINFGLIYGMSAFGLMRTTDLTLAEAENFVEAYFKQFPGVKSFLDGIRKMAAEQGYVETLLGRKRYFPNLASGRSYAMRNREEREAINAPIQGTAADILKLAMLRIPGALAEAGLKARMLLQVHDELVFECPKEQVMQTAQLVQQVMREAYSLKAPLQTEARYGINWGELEVITA